jgi:hypothetical protein
MRWPSHVCKMLIFVSQPRALKQHAPVKGSENPAFSDLCHAPVRSRRGSIWQRGHVSTIHRIIDIARPGLPLELFASKRDVLDGLGIPLH